jgi:riboflavin biosynthesis pyrimidine reductase
VRQLLPDARVDPPLDEVYAWPDGRCLRVNFVASVDGAATLDGRSGTLSSPLDKAVFHHLRATCDVVLVGAGTARTEQYGPARAPVAVVSNRLSLNIDDRLFSQVEGRARPLLLVPASVDEERRRVLEPVADVAIVGDASVDLALVVAELDRRGLRRILCEGGPVLFGDLVQQHRVDELCLTMAPLLVAGNAPRIAHTALGTDPVGLTLLTLLEDSGELLARYAVA